MVYVDLPGAPECPKISKDIELSQSKNALENPQKNNSKNGSTTDLNDNRTSDLPQIFAVSKNEERTTQSRSWDNYPECGKESIGTLKTEVTPSMLCITDPESEKSDMYSQEKQKHFDIKTSQSNSLLNNESKDVENNTISTRNITDNNVDSYATDEFDTDCEIEIVPEFTALDNGASPLLRSRMKHIPKCTNKVTLSRPDTTEADQNSESTLQNLLYNFETSVTQYEQSVLDSPISVSDYVDRRGESNDPHTLPHCFFGGFDIANDSNLLHDFANFHFDEEDYSTTIIVQEGDDDDDSVIILHTEQSGKSQNPPNILWNEPRVLSSLSDVSLIDVEDSSLWKDCALLKDYSPSTECSPFKDFASLNDFSLMGETSPSPLQNVSPLENSSLVSTRDNSPSRETNSVKEISLQSNIASPMQDIPPLPMENEKPETSPSAPPLGCVDGANSTQGDVSASIPITAELPGKGASTTEPALDTYEKPKDTFKTSLISTKLTQDTIPTNSHITTKASLATAPEITASPANDNTIESPMVQETCSKEIPTYKEHTKIQDGTFPFGMENKSRGILASCQVPKSVAEIPEALLNMKDTHIKSPTKHSKSGKSLQSRLHNENCKGNSWRDFKMDPSDIVDTLTRPYREREKHKPKSTKTKSCQHSSDNSSGIKHDRKESLDGKKGSQKTKNDIGDSFGPRFFADLCSLWPDIIVRLAHDISLESPSVEEAPDPPDPPSLIESERRESCDGEEEILQSPRPQPNSPRPQPEGKCCSDEDPCCPQLMAEHTSELRAAAAAASTGSPKRQVLLSGPCISAGLQPVSCPSPICGSPAPRRPRPMSSSGPSSVESIDSTDTADISMAEFFSGDLEDLLEIEATTPPDGDLDGTERSSGSWDQKPNERKRRKLPEIPKNKKSFSTASILALRSGPTLAEELHEAESGVASRSSTPDALTLINNHSRPILVLKCHSYIRDDSSSPDSELRLPINDIDSGNSTQHSPDGAKSMSPQATVNGSGGVPFPQLELLEATHRGLYRFIPRHHDEVEIEIGDPIYVQKEADDLWCEGVNLRTGRQGIFPGAHVTDVDYSDFDPSVPKVKKERYLLNYLGSIETLCHKGNQVLCQAVRKIAGGEESVQHPHPCILEVSDQGIRMLDKSKPGPNHVPCHDYFYHLKHVSFCAFHPKDHRYFGFITKHPTIQRFACHVFRSNDSTRPVAEAVGRAFQRFYQKFIETAYPIEDIYLE
ncbi:uncharacterized protein LOC135196151 isoform X2 [Macrobrachium nipponense]|uniref:uncharacterized protein LOC135196151 isoform X2 n=1 Tax=Macrobrachium nipponense TaxID=159736 RepID=UPI0030C86BD0